jgi:hypothetical protein
MMRQIFHVMPMAGGWRLVPEGGDPEPGVHRNIEEAVQAARSALRMIGSGQIVIHNPDGSVEEEYS